MYYDITHKHPKLKKKKGVQYYEHKAHFQYKELYNRLVKLMVEFNCDRVGREGVYFQEDDKDVNEANKTIQAKVKALSMPNIFNKQPIAYYFSPFDNANAIKQKRLLTNQMSLTKTKSISNNVNNNCDKDNNNKSKSQRFVCIFNSFKNPIGRKIIFLKEKKTELIYKSNNEGKDIEKGGASGMRDVKVYKRFLSEIQKKHKRKIDKKVIRFKKNSSFVLPCI